jgi:thioredoxin 1
MRISAKLEYEWPELLGYEGMVLLYCWAHWCVDSQDIMPLIDQLTEKYRDHIKVFKINIDENPKIAHTLGLIGINSIPIAFIFKEGKLVGKVTGMAPYEAFCGAVISHLGNGNSVH